MIKYIKRRIYRLILMDVVRQYKTHTELQNAIPTLKSHNGPSWIGPLTRDDYLDIVAKRALEIEREQRAS